MERRHPRLNTHLCRTQVEALIADKDQWARVKDVLQTQGNLRLDFSCISLLEQADLVSSSDLAFEYIMAVSDFGFR